MTVPPGPLRPHRPPVRPLPSLVAEFGLSSVGTTGLTVTGVTQRAQSVQPGDLFVGLPAPRCTAPPTRLRRPGRAPSRC